jgi:hypothetical protein
VGVGIPHRLLVELRRVAPQPVVRRQGIAVRGLLGVVVVLAEGHGERQYVRRSRL